MSETYLTNIDFPDDMYSADAVLAERVDTQLTRLDRALSRCKSEDVTEWLSFHKWKTKKFTSRSHIKKHMRLLINAEKILTVTRKTAKPNNLFLLPTLLNRSATTSRNPVLTNA